MRIFYSGPNSFGIKNYSSPADLATDVEAFVDEAGLPWLIVGTLITTGAYSGLVAINFANTPSFLSDSTPPGSGLSLGGSWTTPGYAPGTDYASAKSIILALLGNKTL